jgi:hypothetical protein
MQYLEFLEEENDQLKIELDQSKSLKAMRFKDKRSQNPFIEVQDDAEPISAVENFMAQMKKLNL